MVVLSKIAELFQVLTVTVLPYVYYPKQKEPVVPMIVTCMNDEGITASYRLMLKESTAYNTLRLLQASETYVELVKVCDDDGTVIWTIHGKNSDGKDEKSFAVGKIERELEIQKLFNGNSLKEALTIIDGRKPMLE